MQNEQIVEELVNPLSKYPFLFMGNETYFLEMWGADYQEVHQIQLEAVEYIRRFPKKKLFIFCNHPHCFTLGKGLQKKKGIEKYQLVDFNPELKNRLNIPLYEIKRGGGLTFHYPGQWVCYPIVSLNKQTLDVYKLMKFMLDISQKALEELFNISDLSSNNELLGLWYGRQKLASIGVGVRRFVTYHGIALNLYDDKLMFSELQKVYPCGLPGDTYTSVESIIGSANNLLEKFHKKAKEVLLTDLFF